MGALASQITSLSIFYSNVYSGGDQRKRHVTGLCAGNLPVTAQMASNSENVSILRRHHAEGGPEDKRRLAKVAYGSGHETAAVLLPGFAISW